MHRNRTLDRSPKAPASGSKRVGKPEPLACAHGVAVLISQRRGCANEYALDAVAGWTRPVERLLGDRQAKTTGPCREAVKAPAGNGRTRSRRTSASPGLAARPQACARRVVSEHPELALPNRAPGACGRMTPSTNPGGAGHKASLAQVPQRGDLALREGFSPAHFVDLCPERTRSARPGLCRSFPHGTKEVTQARCPGYWWWATGSQANVRARTRRAVRVRRRAGNVA